MKTRPRTFRPNMARERKFRQGPLVSSVADVVLEMIQGRWMYLGKKPKHPSVMKNMSIATLDFFVRRNGIRYAIKNEEKL